MTTTMSRTDAPAATAPRMALVPSGRGGGETAPGRPRAGATPAAIDAARASASREVLIAIRMPGAAGHPIATFRQADMDNLRRGVRYRVLVPDRARTMPGIAARLRALAFAGADVRTTPDVPLDALAVDGVLAAVVRTPGAVGAVVEQFERAWASATPLAACEDPAGDASCGGVAGELTGREREILALLSTGCTDEAVAARLDISVRTVRRLMAGIMDRLGARSRFEAGVKAADRGWLDRRAG